MVLCLKTWKSRSLPGFLIFMNKECAIFIPARGGSKGLKNKNLKMFANKPLVWWSIDQAKKTIFKDDIYLSSDSEKILDIARINKIHHIKRPKFISSDNSTTEESVLHFLKKIKITYKYVILLQPTSPLRYRHDIEDALKKIKKEKTNSLFSACYFSDFTIWQKKNKLAPYNYSLRNRQMRQDHAGYYLENGSIYIFKTESMIKNKNRFDKNSISTYLMEKIQTFEIDDIKDFILCEKIFKEHFR